MYPTSLACYLIKLRKIYDHLGPCLGTRRASTLSHTSPFYFVHFSVTLVKLSIATSPFVCLENLSIFFLHYKPWKTETRGFSNIKIGQTVQMLWARKVRWSKMKQEKVAFFSPPSFKKSLEWPKKMPKHRFLMQKFMRNPLIMISKHYVKPFCQKLTIYANYPQNCTLKKGPLPHSNTP